MTIHSGSPLIATCMIHVFTGLAESTGGPSIFHCRYEVVVVPIGCFESPSRSSVIAGRPAEHDFRSGSPLALDFVPNFEKRTISPGARKNHIVNCECGCVRIGV